MASDLISPIRHHWLATTSRSWANWLIGMAFLFTCRVRQRLWMSLVLLIPSPL